MNIQLYCNYSEKNHVDKNIVAMGSSINGVLRDDCSIINPVIKIEAIEDFNLATCNYCYITEFGRYYYINNIVCSGKFFELHMHVDVLMTYKAAIRSNTAVISRQQRAYNLYLQDGVFKTYADPHIEIRQFPVGFTDYNFIFSVAG